MKGLPTWCCLPTLAAIGLFAAACSAPVRNVKLADDSPLGLDAKTGYRLIVARRGQQHGVGKTLIVASFSGGGTRGTALAAGALKAMGSTVWTATGRSMADEIDIVSSASGGSVTAAHFGLFGIAGLEKLERNFIRKNNISALVLNALRPDHLLLLATPRRARIDSLIDVFRERLFSGPDGKALTYGNLLDRDWIQKQQADGAPHRAPPYVILNASDMGSGTVFPFIQDWFDLICSDLAKFPIAAAVGASAAFPVALSPVLLKNHTTDGCAAQEAARMRGEWPSKSWANAIKTSPYVNPSRNRRAQIQAQYIEEGSKSKRFVHLLDGGIADNLGISEPLHLLSAATAEGSLRQAILDLDIKRIVWVVVNARSEKGAELDASDATPGTIDQLLAVSNAGVDNTTFARLYQMRNTLRDVLTRDIQNQIDNAVLAGNGTAEWVQRLRERRLKILRNLDIQIIPVDFDFVGMDSCRKALKGIKTWWNLPDREIDLLLAVGSALVYRAPDYADLYKKGVIRPPEDVRRVLGPILHTEARNGPQSDASLGKQLVDAACLENL